MIDLPKGLLAPTAERHVPWFWILFFSAIAVLGTLATIAVVQFSYAFRIAHSAEDADPAPVAIVLGASVNKDGTPSDALRDRILTGADLYREGKVDALLLSGDDGKFHVDEVDAMKKTAIEAGVPESKILIDGKGYRTFESCSHAIGMFYVTKAIIVTQRFHIGRALFLCNELGIDASGVTADRETYVNGTWFWARDLLASAKAFWDVYAHRPAPPVRAVVSKE
jgi:SanA protein